jgi:6-phosphogluconolactonase (cycloisomerase 2 family)
MSSQNFPSSIIQGQDPRLNAQLAEARAQFNKQYNPWVRNASWPAIPAIANGEQVVYCVVAVYPGDHYLALNVSGNYTVDWGDGSAAQNVAATVQANKKYTYATLAGAQNADGYKTVLLKITPQAGQSLTSINFNLLPVIAGISTIPAGDTNLLEVTASVPNMTGLTSNVFKIATMSPAINSNMLERFNLVASALTSYRQFFYNLYNLQSYELNTSAVLTDCVSTFNNCQNLLYASWFDTSKVTSFGNIFYGCTSLLSCAKFDTSAATDVSYFFQSCISLLYAPLSNFPLVLTAPYMYSQCSSMLWVPNLYMPLMTNGTSLLGGCFSLQYAPAFNFPSCINATTMLSSCTSLKEIPNVGMNVNSKKVVLSSFANNCVSVTESRFVVRPNHYQTDNLYYGCIALRTIGSVDLTGSITASNMFYNCYSLTSITLLNTGNVQTWNNAFSRCFNLQTVYGLTLRSSTDISSLFNTCWNLRFVEVLEGGQTTYLQPIGSQPSDVLCTQDGLNVYVTNSGAATLSIFFRNPDGSVRGNTTIATGTTPRYIAISPDGLSLYVANNGSNNISVYTRDATGWLTSNGTVATGNTPMAMAISDDGAFLYVGNQGSTTISQFARNTTTGVLTPLATPTVAAPSSPSEIKLSPDQAFLYILSTSNQTLRTYTRDTTTGQLTQLGTDLAHNAGAAMKFVMSNDGAFIYLPNYNGANSSSIITLTRNTTTGVVAYSAALSLFGLNFAPQSLALSKDGTSLYAISALKAICQIDVNTATGALTYVQSNASNQAASGWTGMSLSPDDKNLYTVSNTESWLWNYNRDTATGKLSGMPGSSTVANLFNQGTYAPIPAIPAINANYASANGNMFANNKNMTFNYSVGHRINMSVSGSKMGAEALKLLMDNLATPATTQTITVSGTPGADTARSLAGTTTAGSNVIAMANTTNILVGDLITAGAGTGLVTARAVTFSAATSTVNYVAHGLPDGKPVSFPTVVTTPNLSLYNIYYVVNATADTFQLAYTQGGTPIAFSLDGTGTMLVPQYVTAVTTNSSITLDAPCSASGATTIGARTLNVAPAIMKRWSIG